MSLIPDKLRKAMERIREGEPGSRFQEHYRERQKSGKSSHVRRWLFLGGGTLIILAGIFFLPAPGPGFIIIFLGGGLVAQESLIAARALDWTEVKLRAMLDFARRTWERASTPVRVLIVIAAIIIGGAAAYGAYWFMFVR